MLFRDTFFAFPSYSEGSVTSSTSTSTPSIPCTVLLSQHKSVQLITGTTGVTPLSSTLDSTLLQSAAVFVQQLNNTHAGSSPPFRFVMEFLTNRPIRDVDVSGIPEGILLVTSDNWQEAMGPLFATRNLQHHRDVQQVAYEQQRQLRAGGGFQFKTQKYCNQECHSNPSAPSLYANHSHCKNPLNRTNPVPSPLHHPRPGQVGCECVTGCVSRRCVCRTNGLACTTACHGFHGHELCTNRSVLRTSSTPSIPGPATLKRTAAGMKGGVRKKTKGTDATLPVNHKVDSQDDDEKNEDEDEEEA